MSPDKAALWSTILAVVSLVVSGVVAWRQHASTGRAHFTADWDGPSNVVFVNHGPGAAKDVVAELKDAIPAITGPIPYVGPFQPTRFLCKRALGAPLGALELSWRDNRRREQNMEIQLSLPRSAHRPMPRDGLAAIVRTIASEDGRIVEGLDLAQANAP